MTEVKEILRTMVSLLIPINAYITQLQLLSTEIEEKYVLTTRDAADLGCMSQKTLLRKRDAGEIHSFPAKGHGCRFRISDIEKLKKNRLN